MSCVPRIERTPGTSTPGITLKGTRVPPLSRPSIAASFIGWYFVTCTADLSPNIITTKVPTIPTIAPTIMLFFANSTSLFFMRYQQLIPTTTTPPTSQPLDTEWKNLLIATGLVATAQKSTISLRTVSGLNCMPTGCCIHALAMSIHKAETDAPITVIHVDVRWKPLLTLFQPKNITAINVASMKNATIPSIARGAPKISPTNHE